MRGPFLILFLGLAVMGADNALETARNRQDRAALEKAGEARQKAAKNAVGQYRRPWPFRI